MQLTSKSLDELKVLKSSKLQTLQKIYNYINQEYFKNGRSIYYKDLTKQKLLIQKDIKEINNSIVLKLDVRNVFIFSAE